MTAPGENLDFMASAYFRERAGHLPGLLGKVKAAIQSDPRAGRQVCPGIMELEVDLEGLLVTVLLARRGNKVNLMYAYRPSEKALLAGRKRQLIRLYGKGEQK
jgi:hypothetical protein